MNANLGEQLTRTREQFPFPDGEIRRLHARQWILNYIPTESVGAEIGVFRGHFTEVILGTNKPKKLYLVDPWTKIGESFSWSDEYTNFGTLPTLVARQEVELVAAEFPDTETVIIEDNFPDGIDKITDPLDWAYLDASHSYHSTLTELHALTTILSGDGVIIGDDWAPDPAHKHHGVFRAVQEFVRDSDFLITAAGPGAQWHLGRRPIYER